MRVVAVTGKREHVLDAAFELAHQAITKGSVALIDAEFCDRLLPFQVGAVGLGAFLQSRCRVEHTLCATGTSGLYTIRTDDCIGISAQAFRGAVRELPIDTLIMLCPALGKDGFHRAVSAATEAVVVEESRERAAPLLALLSAYGLERCELRLTEIACFCTVQRI